MPRGVPKDGKKRKYKKRSQAPKNVKAGNALADAIQGYVKAAIKQEVGQTVNLLKLATKKNGQDIAEIKEIL